MAITLRYYQEKQHEETWSNFLDSPIIVSPCGSGKGSLIAYELYKALEQNKRVLVICPTDYLIFNIISRFVESYPDCARFISDDWRAKSSHMIMVGHYSTIVNRLDWYEFDLIFIDEAHITACQSVTKIVNHHNVRTMGWTATPRRLGGEPLDMFDRIVPTIPLRQFINEGWLADYELESSFDPEINELMKTSINDMLGLQQELRDQKNTIANTVELWGDLALGMKTIIFCTGHDHGIHLQDKFNTEYKKHGYVFEFVDKNTPKKDRLEATKKLQLGQITGIININLLILGVNVPDCSCTLFDRATQSLVNYMQMAGRSLRKKEYKTEEQLAYARMLESRGYDPFKAKILDPVGNVGIHGDLDFDHEWSLSGKLKKDSVYQCEKCGIPLMSRKQVLSYGWQGVEVDCPRCHTLNMFQCIPTKRDEDAVKPTYEGVVVSLRRFNATPDEFRIKRLLMDPKARIQDKRSAIIKSDLDMDKKRAALRYIGLSENTINLYL